MICRKCGYDMLDARLGGLCCSCEGIENLERDKADRRVAAVLLAIIAIGVLCSVAWGILKVIAVIKWILK